MFAIEINLSVLMNVLLGSFPADQFYNYFLQAMQSRLVIFMGCMFVLLLHSDQGKYLMTSVL